MKGLRILFWIFVVINLGIKAFIVQQLDTQPISDFVRYYQAAIGLSEGEGFRMFGRLTAFQGVGYPAFLAFFFFWFGPSVLLAKVLNWILSAVGVLLFYFIIRKFASEAVAMLATLIYCYLPKEMLYVNVLGTELLFNTLLLGYLYCYFSSWTMDQRSRTQWLWLLVAGLILGYMSLVKPASPLFGLIVFFGELGRHILPSFFGDKEQRDGWWRGMVRTAIVAVVSLAVIAPWSYRNYLLFDAFIPMTTNGGYVLYVNNNPYAQGAWMDPYEIPGSPIHEIPYAESDPRFEAAMDTLMKQAAKEWIAEHPGRFLELSVYRLNETFFTNWDWKWAFELEEEDRTLQIENMKQFLARAVPVAHSFVTSSFFIGYVPFLVGFLLRGRTLRKMNRYEWEKSLGIMLFCLPAFMHVFITMVFEGNARYSFPCHPAFALFSALVAERMFKGYKNNTSA